MNRVPRKNVPKSVRSELETTDRLLVPSANGAIVGTDRDYDVSICAMHSHGPLVGSFLEGNRLSCFLGLSPTTPFVNRGRLRAILSWVLPRSDSVLIVEGFSASRWNLVGIRGLTLDQAAGEVQKNIQRLRRRVDDIISRMPGSSVRFLDWQGELSAREYIKIEEAIRGFASTHAEFRLLLNETTRGYVTKVHPTEANKLSKEQWDTLSRYVVEEIAMFLHLYKLGYKVEVYPGSDLEIVKAACTGRFAGFPVPCPERSHVSLELTPI